ncbi:MAG: bis(5'-nucleosyl)-tetraphosphatase (symmetrical) YqeK [Mycobacterium leprae]
MNRWSELEATLARQIGGERLAHTYRVLDTARALSRQVGAPVEKAEVAALMHDYAKHMSGEELLAIARRHGLIIDPVEESQPQLLHGAVAAQLLAEQGLVTDREVLDAIRWHSTGRAGMNLLERVIWLADYIEPGRKFPGVDLVRSTARQDIDRALLMALDNTITFVISRGWLLHLSSVHARNWLLSEMSK